MNNTIITFKERAAGLRTIARHGNLWPEATEELNTLATELENLDHVYIVERESGDSLESDVFLNHRLATRWRNTCNGRLYTESLWSEEFTNEMIATYNEAER